MTDNTERYMIDDAGTLIDKKNCTCYDYLEEILPILNQQENRIKELEQENKMLKITISRNEAYIKRVTTKGKWSNTGDVE